MPTLTKQQVDQLGGQDKVLSLINQGINPLDQLPKLDTELEPEKPNKLTKEQVEAFGGQDKVLNTIKNMPNASYDDVVKTLSAPLLEGKMQADVNLDKAVNTASDASNILNEAKLLSINPMDKIGGVELDPKKIIDSLNVGILENTAFLPTNIARLTQSIGNLPLPSLQAINNAPKLFGRASITEDQDKGITAVEDTISKLFGFKTRKDYNEAARLASRGSVLGETIGNFIPDTGIIGSGAKALTGSTKIEDILSKLATKTKPIKNNEIANAMPDMSKEIQDVVNAKTLEQEAKAEEQNTNLIDQIINNQEIVPEQNIKPTTPKVVIDPMGNVSIDAGLEANVLPINNEKINLNELVSQDNKEIAVPETKPVVTKDVGLETIAPETSSTELESLKQQSSNMSKEEIKAKHKERAIDLRDKTFEYEHLKSALETPLEERIADEVKKIDRDMEEEYIRLETEFIRSGKKDRNYLKDLRDRINENKKIDLSNFIRDTKKFLEKREKEVPIAKQAMDEAQRKFDEIDKIYRDRNIFRETMQELYDEMNNADLNQPKESIVGYIPEEALSKKYIVDAIEKDPTKNRFSDDLWQPVEPDINFDDIVNALNEPPKSLFGDVSTEDNIIDVVANKPNSPELTTITNPKNASTQLNTMDTNIIGETGEIGQSKSKLPTQDRDYNVISNKATEENVNRLIKENSAIAESILDDPEAKPLEKIATGFGLIEEAAKQKNYEAIRSFASKTRRTGTDIAQALQYMRKDLSDFAGAMLAADKTIQEAIPKGVKTAIDKFDSVEESLNKIDNDALESDIIKQRLKALEDAMGDHGSNDIPKDKIDELNEKIREYEKNLKDKDKNISGLNQKEEKLLSDIVDLKNQIVALKDDASKSKIKLTLEQRLAGKIKQYVTPIDESKIDPDVEQEKIILQQLTKIAKQFMPEKLKKQGKTITIFDILKNANDDVINLSNYDPQFSKDFYKDIYYKAQDLLKDEKLTPEQKKNMGNFLKSIFTKGYTDNQVAQATKQLIKDKKLNLGDLVKSHYSNVHKGKEDLVTDLLKVTGIDKNQAARLIGDLDTEFYKLVNSKKESLLKQALKTTKRIGTPKKAVDRLLKLHNLGALNNKTRTKAFEEIFKLPTLTDKNIDDIQNFSDEIQQLKKGSYERQTKEALLVKYINDLTPSTTGQKLKSLQDISFLSNPMTHAVNITGNTLKGGLDISTDAVQMLLGLGKKEKDIAGFIPSLGAYGKAWVSGAKKGFKEAKLGINTTKLDKLESVQNKTIFGNSNNLLSRTVGKYVLEPTRKAVYGSLGTMDRAFYEARKAMVTKQLEEANKTRSIKYTPEEIENLSTQKALESTFQDKNLFSDLGIKIRSTLDKPTEGLIGKGYGLGSAVIPYAQTPGAVLKAGSYDYTPLGSLSLLKDGLTDYEKGQIIARSLLGTGVIGGGYALNQANVLTPSVEGDTREQTNRIRDMRKAEKRPPQSLSNLDISRLAPISSLMDIGAIASNKVNKGINPLEALVSGYLGSSENIKEMPALKGVKDILDAIDSSKSTSEIPGNILENSLTRLNPGLMKFLTTQTDPIVRATYDKNKAIEGFNKIKSGLPFVSNTMPVQPDIYNNIIEKVPGSSSSIETLVRSLLPVRINNSDPKIAKINDELIKAKIFIDKQPEKVDKEKLSSDKMLTNMSYSGNLRRTLNDKVINSDTYKKLDQEQKTALLKSINKSITNINQFVNQSKDDLSLQDYNIVSGVNNKGVYTDSSNLVEIMQGIIAKNNRSSIRSQQRKNRNSNRAESIRSTLK